MGRAGAALRPLGGRGLDALLGEDPRCVRRARVVLEARGRAGADSRVAALELPRVAPGPIASARGRLEPGVGALRACPRGLRPGGVAEEERCEGQRHEDHPAQAGWGRGGERHARSGSPSQFHDVRHSNPHARRCRPGTGEPVTAVAPILELGCANPRANERRRGSKELPSLHGLRGRCRAPCLSGGDTCSCRGTARSLERPRRDLHHARDGRGAPPGAALYRARPTTCRKVPGRRHRGPLPPRSGCVGTPSGRDRRGVLYGSRAAGFSNV